MNIIVKRSIALTLGWCALLAASGCTGPSGGTPVSPSPESSIKVIYKPVCPKIVMYSKDSYDRLAAEISAHPDLVEVVKWLSDYTGLRDGLKACQSSTTRGTIGNN